MGNAILDVVSEGMCCCCGTCGAVCPESAIRFQYRSETGMFTPSVVNERCISCGRCASCCPATLFVRSALQTEGKRVPVGKHPLAVFAAYARDDGIRWNATSGGVISTMVAELLRKGRYRRAYLVDFDAFRGLQAELKPVEDAESVAASAKSKYVPVSVARVADAIAKGTISGSIIVCTPCQLRALRKTMKMCGQDDADVLFIGLFCQSMFNYNVYSHYERKYGRFDRMFFREKDPNGWPGDTTLISGETRRKVDRAVRMSLKDAYSMKCCGVCSDKLNEAADVCVGDCYISGFSRPDGVKGVSSVIVRTERGREAFEACRPSLVAVPTTYDMVRLSQQTMPSTELDGRMYNVCIDIQGLANRGQWLMFEAILEQVRGRMPNAILFVDGKAFVQHPAFFRQKGVLPLLNPGCVDLLLYAPGFRFSSQFTRDVNIETRVSGDIAWFKSFDKPGRKIVFLLQAFGPFEDETSKRHVRGVIECADLVFARDRQSNAALVKVLGEDSRIALAPDFTCVYHDQASVSARFDGTYVVVIPNVQMIVRNTAEGAEGYRRFMRGLLELLVRKGERIVLLNHAGEPDDEPIAQFNATIQGRARVVSNLSAGDCKSVIAGAKLLVTSRFHGLVSGLSEGVPVLCTSWSHKYRELMSEMGLDAGCLDVADVAASLRTVEDALQAPSRYRADEEHRLAWRLTVYAMWDRIWSIVPDWAFRSRPPAARLVRELLHPEIGAAKPSAPPFTPVPFAGDGVSDSPVTVIVPIYNGLDHVKRLLSTLSDNTPEPDCRILLVDDASPDPAIAPFLAAAAEKDSRIQVVRNERNLGFVKTANRGLRMAGGTHCVLLNSDTQVPKGWLRRLMLPIREDPSVASATPFSNGAQIFSLPVSCSDNRDFLRRFTVDEIDAVVSTFSLPKVQRVAPCGHGFCLAMNGKAIEAVGLLDEETFARGYGEEIDWCLRTSKCGFHHEVVSDLFVAHHHCGSFIPEEKRRLLDEHAKIIEQRYPDYKENLRIFQERGNGPAWRALAEVLLTRLAPQWNTDGKPARRILMISHELTVTGAPQSLLRQARYLRDAGHIVTVWTLRGGGLGKAFRDEGFDVQVIDRAEESIRKACTELRVKYDLIVCNTVATFRFIGFFNSKLPVVWFIRELAALSRAWNRNPTILELIQRHSRIYTVSEYARSALSHINPRIRYFNNSVPDSFTGFSPLGTAVRFGFIGGINANKNIAGLVEAFLAVQRDIPSITLDICGKDITGTGLLESLQAKTQGNPSVRWLGERYGEEKAAYFDGIDVLCVPSLSESSCLSLLEGAMKGKAIISTDRVGANYILASGGGIIVPAGSVVDLRQAIETLACDPKRVEWMQRQVRAEYLRQGTEKQERDAVLKMFEDISCEHQEKPCDHSTTLDGRQTPLVSVILPVCNAARYLEECLGSILTQTLQEIEVICVDEGSTDGSADILTRYEAGDSRVKVIRQANANDGAARNRGMDAAVGRYFCFCAPDGYLSPCALDLMRCNAELEGADICLCLYDWLDSVSETATKVSSFGPGLEAVASSGRRSVSPREIADDLFSGIGCASCNMLFRRELAERNKLRFQEFSCTNDLFFAASVLAHAGRITWVDDSLFHCRKDISSVMMDEAMVDSFCEGLQALKNRLVKDGLYELYGGSFTATAIESLANEVGTCHDIAVLRGCYPQMRTTILTVIDSPALLNDSNRRLFDLVRDQEDVLPVLKWICDCQRERCKRLEHRNEELLVELKSRHGNRAGSLKRVRMAEKKARLLNARLRKATRMWKIARKGFRREICSLRTSASYRLGLLLTWPLRKAYRLMRPLPVRRRKKRTASSGKDKGKTV